MLSGPTVCTICSHVMTHLTGSAIKIASRQWCQHASYWMRYQNCKSAVMSTCILWMRYQNCKSAVMSTCILLEALSKLQVGSDVNMHLTGCAIKIASRQWCQHASYWMRYQNCKSAVMSTCILLDALSKLQVGSDVNMHLTGCAIKIASRQWCQHASYWMRYQNCKSAVMSTCILLDALSKFARKPNHAELVRVCPKRCTIPTCTHTSTARSPNVTANLKVVSLSSSRKLVMTDQWSSMTWMMKLWYVCRLDDRVCSYWG